MNILIVNGFTDKDKSKKQWFEFEESIKKTIKKLSSKSGIEDIIYFIRDYKTIDEFLYEQNTKYNNSNHQQHFDKIDFVFIGGSERYLPWKTLGYKFRVLIKMCLITNKTLFCSSVGMQVILYFLATNFNDVNIINKNGEIKTIEEIDRISTNFLVAMKKNDYFLDYVSGDIYEYRQVSNEWIPTYNIGLHHKMLADNIFERGRFVLNKTYKSISNVLKKEDVLLTSNTQIKAKIHKTYLTHWLFKDIPSEFIVDSTSIWVPHNFCLNSMEVQYKILAESSSGQLIIEYENSISCNFHISSKYRETETILLNFIQKKFDRIHTRDTNLKISDINEVEFAIAKKSKESFLNENDKIKENEILKKLKKMSCINNKNNITVEKRPGSSSNILSSRPFNNPKMADRLSSHCGFGFSNRDKIYVEYNSINLRPITSLNKIPIIESFEEREKRKNYLEGTNIFFNGDIKSLKLIGPPSPESRFNLIRERDYLNRDTTIDELKKYMKENDLTGEYLNFVDKNIVSNADIIKFYKFKRRQLEGHVNEITKRQEKKPSFFLDKTHSRNIEGNNFLINKNESTMKDKNSILNQMKNMKNSESLQSFLIDSIKNFNYKDTKTPNIPRIELKNESNERIAKIIIQNNEKNPPKVSKLSRNNKNTYFYNNSINLKNSREIGQTTMIQNKSIRISSPYKSVDKIRLKEKEENKNKWLSKQGFSTSYKRSDCKNIIESNVSSSIPAYKHVFREENSSKWKGKNFVKY